MEPTWEWQVMTLCIILEYQSTTQYRIPFLRVEKKYSYFFAIFLKVKLKFKFYVCACMWKLEVKIVCQFFRGCLSCFRRQDSFWHDAHVQIRGKLWNWPTSSTFIWVLGIIFMWLMWQTLLRKAFLRTFVSSYLSLLFVYPIDS